MSKVQKLGGVLLVLVLISSVLFLFDGRGGSDQIDRDRFVIADTAAIDAIHIQSTDQDIHVVRQGDTWTLNDTLAIDPSLMQITNSIMSQVTVQRPVSQLNKAEVRQQLEKTGQKVTISLGDERRTFYTGGNLQKTQSYFADEELKEVYLVGIPGYHHYIPGIFELTLNQWRDRLLFDSNYRSIQEWTIDYAKGVDLKMEFEDRFFSIAGVQQIDTAALMSYFNGFEQFQLNDYLSPGKYPRYDSLLTTAPIAHLSLTDIDQRKNRVLDIYAKIPGERFYLYSDANKEMIVVDEKRTEALLKSPSQFKRE
ncbi:hypothetical protein SAMN04488028_1011063 [Reichenbachiella agariperforans]|uniref:DUF4340 domain-containing protein n=1 Tax=Reichenbachiella agariperforans TaxID=156994 RepID=A0A1M6LR10_REIAG|nr:DUF4340 domain-containing protein [Reichenbachiella agariperforans]SHJ73606.1 hypothetical protein SAMN04488028_1011063 [Reichenbachiella agariperforans]